MRIIRAGSSARSSRSVMFAAKMSLARLKTGPLNQVARGVEPEFIVPGSLTRRGVLTGTFASRISSSGIGGNRDGAGDCLRRAYRGGDRDGAQQERCCKSSERASEVRLTGHFLISLLPVHLRLRAGARYYSRAVPIPENCQKVRPNALVGDGLAGIPTQPWRTFPTLFGTRAGRSGVVAPMQVLEGIS